MRRRLIQAFVMSLLSTELAVFTDAQGGGKDKDQVKDQSLSPPTRSPSAAAMTDSLVAPQPVITGGGSKIDTPRPSMTSTAVSTFGSTFIGDGSTTIQQSSDKTCPGSLDQQIVIDSSATLYYHLVPSDSGNRDGILCGRLEVGNNNGGWIGFGWSENGDMIGGEAIVGLTDAGSVLKYKLSSKDTNGVTQMPAQTLTDTSIKLEGDKTIMSFTKMLVEDGELEIKETGLNQFLHARGSSGQTIGYHDKGMVKFTRDFENDIAMNPPTPRPTSVLSSPNPTAVIATRPPVLSPTSFMPFPDSQNTTTSAGVNCEDPSLTREDCIDSIYCEWIISSGEKNHCGFGPPVQPTLRPSSPPTWKPTLGPSVEPTLNPTQLPTIPPVSTASPTTPEPTQSPIIAPSANPVFITPNPTTTPTLKPTFTPTESPSPKPTNSPTQTPSAKPTPQPSSSPSMSYEPSTIPSLSPTVSSSPTISSSPTYSPTKTHLPTLPEYEYKRPKRVDMRWVPWDDLDRDIQIEVSEALEYNRISWENLKTNDVEKLRWSDLSDRKKDAAEMLGFDEWSWNCWMNNFESFSWKQLYEWELTTYLESLGWNQQRWNGQNGPPILKTNSWDDLTSEQQQSAMQLCFYKTTYDELNIVEYGIGYPIKRPSARFVPWNDLDSELQATMEQTLGYTEFSWNIPGLNPKELKGWFEMDDSEKRGAEAINCTDTCWDCWQAHYNTYGWQDLVNRGHDEAFVALGWDESSWCGNSEAPVTNKRSWNELTEEEQLNATMLCLDQFNWDQESLEVNTGTFPYIKPPLRYKQWSSLTVDQQKLAQELLYKEDSWNNLGTADIEKRLFDDLTDLQKSSAVELGLYEKTWDCFQNHYRAEAWSDLPPDVRLASEFLGWNQSSWGLTKPTPDIYNKKWDELSTEEQATAMTVCHFDITWPGGMQDQLVASAVQEGAVSQAARMLPTAAIVAAALSVNVLIHIVV